MNKGGSGGVGEWGRGRGMEKRCGGERREGMVGGVVEVWKCGSGGRGRFTQTHTFRRKGACVVCLVTRQDKLLVAGRVAK